MYHLSSFKTIFIASVVSMIVCSGTNIFAQGQTRWIRVGELQDWFSQLGCEWEVGRRGSVADQQDGLQWPARFPDQDSKAAKALNTRGRRRNGSLRREHS